MQRFAKQNTKNMKIIDVTLPIGNDAENKWMAMWGGENVVFSAAMVQRIFDENQDETDFKFNFDCPGGYVDEGFHIYDIMRTSGKRIHCNIVGGCHSMAVVMLLAAPAENRTANKHATSLIHCVRGEFWGDMTADEMRETADDMEHMQNRILEIYADRTGRDIDELRTLMKEEKERDTDFLIEYGFIDHVNAYNTNQKPRQTSVGANINTNPKNKNNMAKTLKEAFDMAANWLSNTRNMLGEEMTNYDHTDADGNVLFSTEADDDTLEVGMPASPDGTFELTDGRTVVIADGVIAEIREPETTTEETTEDNSEEVENLRNQLREAREVINELKSQLKANYKPANAKRTNAPAKTPATATDMRDDVRAKLGLKNKED